VIEMTRAGRVVWSFGATSGVDMLDRPSLAIRLPNGLIAINDDWRHRVVFVDPKTNRIVWQYGHTGVASAAVGYLSKPDGMDFLPATSANHAPFATSLRATVVASTKHAVSPPAQVRVTRVGMLPAATSRLAAVALPDGRVLALGGLVGGSSSRHVLLGTPATLRAVGSLPSPTHDAAAVLLGSRAELFGGGQATSVADVIRVDPRTGAARQLPQLDEPLSDLGAVAIAGRAYLVGGYTGSRFASAVLRVGAADRTTTVARLPAGLRYAGVATLGGKIYVAGGVTTGGASNAILRVDPGTHRVVRIGRLPQPIAHAPLVAANGALWLIGGDGSRAILRIDPRTGAVVRAGRLPVPLANAAAVALPDGRIVVLGGDGSAVVWEISQA